MRIMDHIIAYLKAINLILYIIIGLGMAFWLLKLLSHLWYQLVDLWHSWHLEKFLDKKFMSALELLEQYRSFQIFLVPASRTKGFGTRALYRQVMKQARKEIAICNFDNNIFLSIYCLSCYYWPACTYKYHMNCTYCRNRKCEKRQSGKQVCCDLECFRHKHKA